MRTRTSKFGVGSRLGHDSSAFYNSRKYRQHEPPGNGKPLAKEQRINHTAINKVHHKSSENMSELPDNSIHLMVTSPPYNVGKEYDDDLTTTEFGNVAPCLARGLSCIG